MPRMNIEFFTPSRLETTIDLLHEMSAYWNPDNPSDREAVKKNLLANILGKDSGVRLVLAIEDDVAVALASISLLYPAPKEQGQLFMKDLYVASAKRNCGIGREIMHFIAQYAVRKGCCRFDLTTEDNNPKAMAFYEELGATRVTSKVYYRFSGDGLARFAAQL